MTTSSLADRQTRPIARATSLWVSLILTEAGKSTINWSDGDMIGGEACQPLLRRPPVWPRHRHGGSGKCSATMLVALAATFEGSATAGLGGSLPN